MSIAIQIDMNSRGMNKTVTLCGSTRFRKAFVEWNRRLTIEEEALVFSVAFWAHGDHATPSTSQKVCLDVIHKRKIDKSDEIFVLDVNGYIGSSTQSEIEYARANGKRVRYLSQEFPNWKESDSLYT